MVLRDCQPVPFRGISNRSLVSVLPEITEKMAFHLAVVAAESHQRGGKVLGSVGHAAISVVGTKAQKRFAPALLVKLDVELYPVVYSHVFHGRNVAQLGCKLQILLYRRRPGFCRDWRGHKPSDWYINSVNNGPQVRQVATAAKARGSSDSRRRELAGARVSSGGRRSTFHGAR